MAEEFSGYPRFQLGLGRGSDMLVIRGDTFEVWAADVQLAKKSVDPEIARFFNENDTGLGAKNADVSAARQNIAQGSPTTQVVSINPTCPTCGGTTTKRQSKTGKTFWSCNQDNGECKNDKGFNTSVWGAGGQKGRDS
jgi:hypothetical protein